MNIIQTMYRMTVLFRTLIIGLMILIPSGLWTEYLFAKVNYPNAGFGGPQATFDVQERRNEYSILAEQETLILFRQVQYVDFGIVVGTFIVFATLLLILAKCHPPQSMGRRLGQLGAVIISLGPLMDFCENPEFHPSCPAGTWRIQEAVERGWLRTTIAFIGLDARS